MKTLQSDFKKSQECHEESNKTFRAELKKSQDLQEDSVKELKKFQILHEDSSKKLADILAHLLEEKKKSEKSGEVVIKSEVETPVIQMVESQPQNECDLSTTNNIFPPNQSSNLANLSLLDSSTSVVKRELEASRIEEETHSKPSPTTDNTIINHLDILDTEAIQDRETVNMGYLAMKGIFKAIGEIISIFKTPQGII